ncbi:MAG: hypothetical protein LC791_07715 [Acidobacteria bacterium]|nr:hypothetical protein [Acidobacteriota bacterium]
MHQPDARVSTLPPSSVFETETERHGAERWILACLVGATLLVVTLSMMRAGVAWRTGAHLTQVSGSWVTLAVDLRDGIFYRPLYGPDGYGGTRFFPLHFVLHAGLMKLGFDVLVAGYILSGSSSALLVGGVYRLLRKLDVEVTLAACAAGLVLASDATQHALLSIRGDGLPAALNIWGIALVLSPGSGALYAAAVLFTLAFSAKVTTVFGLAASVAALLISGRSAQAAKLAGLSAAGMAVVVSVTNAASDGRFFDVLRASASGNTTLRYFLSSPIHFVHSARNVPESLMFMQIGAAALLGSTMRAWGRLPILFFLTATATTLFIFGSPGTAKNHLLDLHVASLIVFATWVTANRRHARFGLAIAVSATLVACLPLWRELRGFDTQSLRAEFEDAMKLVGPTRGTILAESPMLPILAGQRPYVLDPFIFRLAREDNPSFADPLWQKLRDHAFVAVVLENDPDQEYAWYETMHFGTGFLQELERSYQRAGTAHGRTVYRPRQP